MSDDTHRLFALGARGVNVSTAKTHLTEEELISAQNAEFSSDQGRGALDQRPGMTRIGSSATGSGAIAAFHGLTRDFLAEKTPYLYAATASGANGIWRRTTDGVIWENNTPSGGAYACSNFTNVDFYKSWPKLVGLRDKLYYIGQVNTSGTDPLPLHAYNGTRDEVVSYIPPTVAGTTLATPNAPSVDPGGTTGATTYTYKLVARFGAANSAASAGGTTTIGNAALSSSNYNVVTPSGSPVAGATSYDVYRTVGGATTGKIGNIPILNGSFTLGNGGGNRPDLIFTDTGLTGDASAAPGAAVGGNQSANALAVLDMITDGQALYLAVLDINDADPARTGRILRFDPAAVAWTQIFKFPNSSGNGCAGALAFFDGALSFGTYIGPTNGNAGFLWTTAYPLPAGGIIDVKVTTVSIPSPTSLVVFNGELYAGSVSLVAGTAAVIRKRAALAAWSDVLTAPSTADNNVFNELFVWNGRIYAGWYSGDGANPGRIYSSGDGSTWVLEASLNNDEMPCQFAIFNDALYVVTGKTPSTGATNSRVLKRGADGSWSSVDNPSDNLSGGLAVIYQ